MEHYVTIFDSLFLPQGLSLHLSMERHINDYTLWIVCVDEKAWKVLSKLDLPRVRLLNLSALENDALLKVKSLRSKGEYCWTLTPFSPRFVFESSPEIDRVTYIDADLWFRKKPSPIFEEFERSGKAVLITEHGYAAQNDHSATSGTYCVQFMSFVRDESEPVRLWWEQRCLDWCYARLEDGKFGDQRYLEDWPNQFSQLVHVLQHVEYTLAPWNAYRFPYNTAIFWHFHGLRLVDARRRKKVYPGPHPVPVEAFENVYRPYFEDFRHALKILDSVGFTPKAQARIGPLFFFRPVMKKLIASFRANILNRFPR